MEAAKYTASVHPHPLVFVWSLDGTWQYQNYAIGGTWNTTSSAAWPSPIQLAVCEGAKTGVKVGSCGQWKDTGSLVTGQVVRYKYGVTVRVVAARTGKTLSSKTFYGSTISCNGDWHTDDASPPWRIYGGDPNEDTISNYEASLSK